MNKGEYAYNFNIAKQLNPNRLNRLAVEWYYISCKKRFYNIDYRSHFDVTKFANKQNRQKTKRNIKRTDLNVTPELARGGSLYRQIWTFTPTSFSFIFGLFKRQYKFATNNCEKHSYGFWLQDLSLWHLLIAIIIKPGLPTQILQ